MIRGSRWGHEWRKGQIRFWSLGQTVRPEIQIPRTGR